MASLRPLHLVIGVSAGLVLLALLSPSKPRTLGDLAAVGDEVTAPGDRIGIHTTRPGGVIATVKIGHAANGVVHGLVIALNGEPVLSTDVFGQVEVPRSAILSVTRNGQAIERPT
jgi:hypothetical protein